MSREARHFLRRSGRVWPPDPGFCRAGASIYVQIWHALARELLMFAQASLEDSVTVYARWPKISEAASLTMRGGKFTLASLHSCRAARHLL